MPVIVSTKPGGANTQVQFNDSGAFNGDAGLTFDKTNKAISLGFREGTGVITASQRGALAFGSSYSGSDITASGTGSLAFGYAYAGSIQSTSKGSLAFGYAYQSNVITYPKLIQASNFGAIAFGYVGYKGGNIKAYGIGAFAGGFVGPFSGSSTDIKSYGKASFAFGYSKNTDIIASAINSVQFGPGTNAQAYSLQVGSTIRIKGTTGAPASNLHNGDIWEANNYVYIRSNGVSVKIT